MKKVRATIEAIYTGQNSVQRSPTYPGEVACHEFDVHFVSIDPKFTSKPVKRLRWFTDNRLDFVYGQVVYIDAIITENGTIQRPKFVTEPDWQDKCCRCPVNPLHRKCDVCDDLYDVPPTS